MAGKLAEEQINNTGWGFYLNNENAVALQNSCGCESLTDKNTAITPLTTLTTAPYGAQTRMHRAFAGEGGL